VARRRGAVGHDESVLVLVVLASSGAEANIDIGAGRIFGQGGA